MGTILNSIPAEAQITRIEYEGPRIALYTKNPKYLHQNNYIISEIVNTVKKRVVTRTEKSIQEAGAGRQGDPRQDASPSRRGRPTTSSTTPWARSPSRRTSRGCSPPENGFDLRGPDGADGLEDEGQEGPAHRVVSAIQSIYYALKTGSDEREKFYSDARRDDIQAQVHDGGADHDKDVWARGRRWGGPAASSRPPRARSSWMPGYTRARRTTGTRTLGSTGRTSISTSSTP